MRDVLGAAGLVAAMLIIPALAQAQGFGLNEVGTCAVARAGAGTAVPCTDGSAIFWNPAATVRLNRTTVYVGAAGIAVGGDFTADMSALRYDSQAPVEIPPHLFATFRPLPNVAAGLGVYVPYGLTSEWDDGFPGGFASQRASLASIYVQPNVAWDVVPGRFSIGGGPIVGISTVELRQSLDLSEQALAPNVTFANLGIPRATEFATADLRGKSTAIGYNVGAQLVFGSSLTLGVRYLSEMRFDYNNADVVFEQVPTGLVVGGAVPNPTNPTGPPLIPAGTPIDAVVSGQFGESGTLRDQRVRTRIDHPAQFQAGIAFTGFDRTSIVLDYARHGWSAFDELPVRFQGSPSNNFAQPTALDRNLIEDYEDSWSVKGAIDHTFANRWEARVGANYIQSPAPDVTVTPLLPDMDRWNFAGGLGIPLGSRLLLDVAYLRVHTEGRRGRTAERESRDQTTTDLNSGFYRLTANVLSASLRARF